MAVTLSVRSLLTAPRLTSPCGRSRQRPQSMRGKHFLPPRSMTIDVNLFVSSAEGKNENKSRAISLAHFPSPRWLCFKVTPYWSPTSKSVFSAVSQRDAAASQPQLKSSNPSPSEACGRRIFQFRADLPFLLAPCVCHPETRFRRAFGKVGGASGEQFKTVLR